jgi:hypothetical protein
MEKILNWASRNQAGERMPQEINLDSIRLTKAAQDRQQAQDLENMVGLLLQYKQEIATLTARVAELEAKPPKAK